MESIHVQYYGDDRYRPVALARTRMLAGLLGRKSGEGFYSYDDKAAALRLVPQPAALPTDATFWWPMDGPAAVPDSIAALLPAGQRRPDAGRADVIVVAPLGRDLSTTIEDLQLVIADSLGYVAPRVVACIVNLACEMAQQGVASPEDIDVAVRLGLDYPRGPFEWGDVIGPKRLLEILQGLQATFGDPRYRPSPWLVRRARLSLPLSAPDRIG